jgi:ankyrin repeat protein
MNFLSIETLSDLIASQTSKGNTEFASKLIELPLSNKSPISDAIKYCVDNGILDMIELVVLQNYEIKSDSGVDSAFEYALYTKRFQMADEMINKGFNINSLGLRRFENSKFSHVPPIIYSIMKSRWADCDMLKFVLSKKPNLNIKWNLSGETPLMTCLRFGEYSFANLLLDAGAEFMIINDGGHNAFAYCAAYGFGIKTNEIIQRMKIKAESETQKVSVDSKNESAFEIPKILRITIPVRLEKDTTDTKFNMHPVPKNGKVSGRKLANGKWFACEITFPADYYYDIEMPAHAKPHYHIIPDCVFGGEIVILFDRFDYV